MHKQLYSGNLIEKKFFSNFLNKIENPKAFESLFNKYFLVRLF